MKMKLILLVCAFVACFAKADTQKLPVKSFASLRAFSQLKLSPNGDNLAFIRNIDGTLVLTVYNLTKQSLQPVLKSDNHTVFFDWYQWANDEVLLLGVRYLTHRHGGTKYTSTRLFSYNINSKEPIKAAIRINRSRNERQPQLEARVVSFLPKTKNKILIQGDYKKPGHPGVYELDLTSRFKKRIQGARANVFSWIADRQGNVRIARKLDSDSVTYELLNNKTNDWEELFKFEAFSEQQVSILGFDKNPNFLYITALHDGRKALFKVDLTTKHRELIFSDDNYDFDGRIFYSSKTEEVAGFTHSQLPDGVEYWDADLASLHEAIRDALPDEDMLIDIQSTSDDQQKYVMYMSSSTTPGAYLLGDRKISKLDAFATTYPDINDRVYRGKELVSYKARDGLKIEGYLTLPIDYKDGQALPTIILPHGGPMARDYSNFDYWSALFAYHGYAVLQPNFRGSSGYGHAFVMQAVQGYGQAMQDDLQDGALWLVEQGVADKERICIGGASYGGYAALMAVVKHPETFKCAASFGGLSDLEEKVSRARFFINGNVVRKQFGTDDDKLEKSSPVNFANKINRPVLLVHGSDDSVVHVSHSRKMYDELESEGKQVKYIELEGGDHYLSHQPYRVQTLEAFLTFFDENLK